MKNRIPERHYLPRERDPKLPWRELRAYDVTITQTFCYHCGSPRLWKWTRVTPARAGRRQELLQQVQCLSCETLNNTATYRFRVQVRAPDTNHAKLRAASAAWAAGHNHFTIDASYHISEVL